MLGSMNDPMPRSRIRPDPRIRHVHLWRDVPRRGENSTGGVLLLAASLLLTVIALAGLAVAIFVLWPALVLAGGIYLGRGRIRSAARAGRHLASGPLGRWRTRRGSQLPGASPQAPMPALIPPEG